MEDSIEAARATLTRQGVDPDADPLERLSRSGVPDDSLASVSGLPEGRVGPEEDQDLVLVSEIGRGGMGVVFVAKQRALRREVAVKRSNPERDAVHGLVREARIMGSLEHPNVIPVHALLADDQGPAVVMKRVAGVTWAESLTFRAVSIDQHLEIFLQLCNAVAYAHSRGIIHRDIKPSNVLLGQYGEVYLADWGLARRTDEPTTEHIVGSPAYMAPEMLEGSADERTDVYLLGATLHQVLTGSPRHRGNLEKALASIRRSAPFDYPAGIPVELAAICNRACARDPADRFERATELRAAVRAHLRLRPIRSLIANAEARRQALAIEGQVEGAVDRGFTEARFGYEQAIDELEPMVDGTEGAVGAVLADERARAVVGRERLLAAMARIELDRRQPEAARAHVDAMHDPDPELRAEVEELSERLADDRERLSRFEEDRDPAVGAGERSWAQLLLAAAILLVTLLFAVVFAPRREPSPARLVVVGGVVFAVIATVTVVWRRRGRWNLVNRRIAQVAVLASLVSALQRLVGLATGAAALHILLMDAFVLGMAGVVLTPFHRAGPVLTVLSLGVILVGLFDGSLVDEVFVGFAVGVPAVLLARSLIRRLRGSSERTL